MSFINAIKKIEFPDINTVLKSGQNAKNKIENKNANTVIVNFHYADNRFKTRVEGIIEHVSEIPIIYIEYPEKLAFIVPDNSLVYDIKSQCFEVSVNEAYTHCINVTDINNNKILEAIVPYLPEKYEYQLVEIEIKNKNKNNVEKTDKITLTSKMLSSLGRAKILERTIESNNDGLIVMAVIGGLMGFVLGMIVGVKSVM